MARMHANWSGQMDIRSRQVTSDYDLTTIPLQSDHDLTTRTITNSVPEC